MPKQGMTCLDLGGSRWGGWGIWNKAGCELIFRKFVIFHNKNLKYQSFWFSKFISTRHCFPFLRVTFKGKGGHRWVIQHPHHTQHQFSKKPPSESPLAHGIFLKADLPPPPSSPFSTASLSPTQLGCFWGCKCQDGAWNKGRVKTLALWTWLTTD